MVDDAELLARAEALVAAYAADGRTVATAESCTGGLVAGLLTAVPGSSAVLERGFVTYSNEAKAEAIGVPMDLIRRHGAVSEAVARAMAAGALAASRASVAVAITGIAGPGGGSAEKPVGLVHFGLGQRDGETRHLERRYGDLGRAGIRRAAVADALGLLEDALGD
ncbi:nicotinamide-nucleotide amidase [Methylobacterium sp. PvP062]|jgi:nicotinamide-nucleotide amidase|uniref:Nicotinamide-nucleotide amidase n=1 Tax=Methylobacterium radiotolerans TaxID=31998 RepID=A0ABV2NPL9_9HYPH|nr:MULTISPECIES: CinA family protein [Methylobacterium]MCX7334802.1 CinA family protein [Hyphomicrobiales bacterium]GAN48565.1 competence/damage-inducible protein CinA [Methylobacterium sp. ME121]MBN6822462.1 CinA family protein [Methylobacterium organophilum]MBP2494853.1 nicotinamide-nucleotide amidase [Methylobacterium sp. PvP105]MBP2505276.1 nicotinamide-nucleotide amidase [Methylobacterium sp. PvP109]